VCPWQYDAGVERIATLLVSCPDRPGIVASLAVARILTYAGKTGVFD